MPLQMRVSFTSPQWGQGCFPSAAAHGDEAFCGLACGIQNGTGIIGSAKDAAAGVVGQIREEGVARCVAPATDQRNNRFPVSRYSESGVWTSLAEAMCRKSPTFASLRRGVAERIDFCTGQENSRFSKQCSIFSVNARSGGTQRISRDGGLRL